METLAKKYILLKIFFAILPALIFMENYFLIARTRNVSYVKIASLAIWILMIWSVYQLTEKNHILKRFFRLIEISFFLLPLSGLILGSNTFSSTKNWFEQMVATLKTAEGGGALIVFLFLGAIAHLIANRYSKKAKVSGVKQAETLSNKYGIIFSLIAIALLVVIIYALSIVTDPFLTINKF